MLPINVFSGLAVMQKHDWSNYMTPALSNLPKYYSIGRWLKNVEFTSVWRLA